MIDPCGLECKMLVAETVEGWEQVAWNLSELILRELSTALPKLQTQTIWEGAASRTGDRDIDHDFPFGARRGAKVMLLRSTFNAMEGRHGDCLWRYTRLKSFASLWKRALIAMFRIMPTSACLSWDDSPSSRLRINDVLDSASRLSLQLLILLLWQELNWFVLILAVF